MMRRSWLVGSIVGIAGLSLGPAGVRAGGPAPSSGGSVAAVSLRGSIVLFGANGSTRTVLTHSGQDHAPVVAPNGAAIAFWRGQYSSLATTFQQIMVARADGHGGWHVAPFSQRPALAGGPEQTLSWSPDSNALAWFDGTTVQYRHIGGPQRTVLQLGVGNPIYQNGAIAFSRDSGTVATILQWAGGAVPAPLRVAVRRLAAPQQSIITITFRPGILTGRGIRGSVPAVDDLGYTTSQLAPPGHTLQIATVGLGAGRQLTGIFLAPDTGGQAHLVLGNGHGLRNIPPFGPALDGATHFEDSPNGRYLATDPSNGFYITGDVARPLHVGGPAPISCVLAQWTWLSDSTHLAYVGMCTVPGSSPIHYWLTLGVLSIFGGPPTVLYSTAASEPNAIDLAPAYRCVACG